jgi:amino acid adenylation domain-containing protein
MNKPLINERGEVDPKSVERLTRDELALWMKERLRRQDWSVPGGGHESEMPHYLLALLYSKLDRFTREDFQNIIIELLEDLARNPSSELLGEPGHELIMLTDPVLIQSPRREDAIDLLREIANSKRLRSEAWPNLHLRALQGLVALRYRTGVDFWEQQFLRQDTRYAPVILEGLSLIDVAAPFCWLKEIDWDDAVEDGIIGLLPTLLENYGAGKVVASIENALAVLPDKAATALLSYCDQEGMTISQPALSVAQQDVSAPLVNMAPAIFSPPKLALLEKRLKRMKEVGSTEEISPRPRANYFPLSFSQQRMWFVDQLRGGSPFYNVSAALRLNGPLNVSALERCFNEIVRRHEALRTVFRAVDGEPKQVIMPEVHLSLPVMDLMGLSHSEQDARLSRLAEEEAQRPFDLSRGPLLRLNLLRFNEDEHGLLIVMHHIVSDGWSKGIFIRETATLYKAFLAEEPSPLPELDIQYADFAFWQRERLRGGHLDKDLVYWRQQLSGVSEVLALPTDRPRPPVQTFQGAEHRVVLSEELSRNLNALSRQEGVTLFMTLLGAFQSLLYRDTGNEDIVVGAPVANRSQFEIERLIGCFVNTMVLRTHMSGDPTFRELLARVRAVTLGAYVHQNLPFEKVVEVLHPDRDLSRTPLLQVMLVLENSPMPAIELAGLSITPVHIASKNAQFDLTLIVTEEPKGINCVFVYNTDLFDEATILRLADRFHLLLSAIVTQPDSRISTLPLFTPPELQRLLVEWNNTAAAAPPYNSISQWFTEQAERTPTAIALEYADQQVTYRELNERTNQIAHRLSRIGARGEALVGVCIERSLEQIVAILGVLKAGAAYVPLDPTYPKARLDFILQDIQATVVLTVEHLVRMFDNCDEQIVFVCIDTDWPPLESESKENLPRLVEGMTDHPAYVIYTSGSTGAPKGVVITQRNLLHSTAARVNYYHEPVEKFLLLSSFSFDSSVAGIFWTLCSGGTLVLQPEDSGRHQRLIAEQIAERKVSHLLALPSLYRLILEEARATQLDSLRVAIMAGEACPPDLVKRHYGLIPQVALFNEYGPTEATVWSTVYAWPGDSSDASVSIGRPIPNTQIYILDKNLNPAPIGVRGELYIGGGGISRGYLRRPGITAERFVPHPFSTEPGARLYKTGDIARYKSDGNIEFEGRLDYQVKVRGYRIELGEIEAVLRQHTSVGEVAVVIREDTPGDQRLVAYVVGNRGRASATELRSYLADKLPSYMTPSIFVSLDKLPLTTSGKIDRTALPIPDLTRPDLAGEFIAPRTPIEALLAGMWSDLLGVERIGINDNFFDLGGHSLLATRVISQIRATLQVEIPLVSLFKAPTVSGLASTIAQITSDIEVEKRVQLLSQLIELSEEEMHTVLEPDISYQIESSTIEKVCE